MKASKSVRYVALFLLLSFSLSASGCSTLKPNDYEQYGYHGTSAVQKGKRILPVDIIGNIFGVFEKLILWNWKVERHNITADTQQAIDAYLKERGQNLGNVDIELNRYAPQDEFKRLFHNKGVKWPYRYTLGLLSVLIIETLLVGRIFGGDHYNPFTHTVHLYSDLPSVALHELGHANDFSRRRYRGSYALFGIVPFVDLYQEWQATHETFDYVRAEKRRSTEIEAYKILYPAYGTYVGTYIGSPIIGAIVGHIWGRIKAHRLEKSTTASA